MNKLAHAALQFLGIVAHIVNVSAVPGHYQPLVAAIVGALQTGLALANHTTH